MAVSRPVPGNTAATLNSIISLCDAVDSAVQQLAGLQDSGSGLQSQISGLSLSMQGLQALITSLAQSTSAAIQAEQRDRANGLVAESEGREFSVNAAKTLLLDKIGTLDGALRELIADQEAEQSSALAAIDLTQRTALGAAVANLTLLANRFGANGRPGDAAGSFSLVRGPYALNGRREDLPAVPAAMLATGSEGGCVVLKGAGTVGMSDLIAVEPGRVYRARVALERLGDPIDPSNDAVQYGLVFLDAFANILPFGTGINVVEQIDDLRTASGRLERHVTFARSGGDRVEIVVPIRARYARVWVRTFGTEDGVTQIDVVGANDVTDATVLDPISASVASQVAGLVSVNPGPRLDLIEGVLTAPDSVTYRDKGEASQAAIPVSVVTVRLLGGTQANDGKEGVFARTGFIPDGGDGFTAADGSIWARIYQDGAITGVNLSFWQDGASKTLPPQAGVMWDNGGLPSRS